MIMLTLVNATIFLADIYRLPMAWYTISRLRLAGQALVP